MKADLHNHTTASDGSMSPSGVVERAHGGGIELLAITDHDTVSGIDEAREKGAKLGMKIVPGIEISTYSNCEIHILGYNIDYLNPAFLQELDVVKGYRAARNVIIGKKLDELGVHLSVDFAGEGLGRMKIARAMVEEGFARDVNDAFAKYLGISGKAYAEAKRMTPIDAVKLIRTFGGVSVIAHPKKYLLDKRLDMLTQGLKKFGLDGIEIFYPTHTDADIAALKKIANMHNLMATGGSDFHGEGDKIFSFDIEHFLNY